MSLCLTPPQAGNAIKATLRDLTYLGAETQLSLTTQGGVALLISNPTDTLPQGLASGTSVWVAWPEDRGIFL
jgi:putative spermidine/putrescine transport system ATP-binding protein